MADLPLSIRARLDQILGGWLFAWGQARVAALWMVREELWGVAVVVLAVTELVVFVVLVNDLDSILVTSRMKAR
jgi:hypothetical protein